MNYSIPAPRRGRGFALWALAALVTFAALAYQDRMGPTYPLEGECRTSGGPVRFLFPRSETIGRDLRVVLLSPVPSGLRGQVRYRRYRSRDPWTVAEMTRGEFLLSRRGRARSVRGLGAELPSLRERAGKYEYFAEVVEGTGPGVSVTGSKPIYARYKAPVPTWALVLHIAAIFASMLLAVRATLAALCEDSFKRLVWAALAALLLGGFVLGPLVQWQAFGVWWAGWPYGYDWTDNKVVVELLAWVVALWANRGGRRSRWTVLLAGAVTLVVYCIPHSLFGSEYSYITGSGHGTAG